MLKLASALPGQCEVCRLWCDAALCAGCRAIYAAPRSRCRRCAIGLGAAADRCGNCLVDPPPFAAAACAVDYGFPWARLITDLKFHARPELARPLAGGIVAALRAGEWPRPDWVLPVPLSAPRLRERGYNQAWELARHVGAALALVCRSDLLLRVLDTPRQAALGRAERSRNLARAFMVDPRRRELLRGRRVALVDDVMTTGVTAREASAELLRAGAAEVQVWVFARTPAAA